MDRFREMQIFVRVMETGSFSAAAGHLHMGQPAVSKAVAGLEDRLGVRLLVRSTRRLRPTDAGIAFYERATRALSEADEADVAATGLGKGLEGRLRVFAPVTFTRIHVVPKLQSFLAAHPKLRLELVMEDRTVNLVEENIDVALQLGDLVDSTLTARKLGESERYVLASPAYWDRMGTPKKPEDLLAHDGVVYSQTVGGQEWCFKRGASEATVRIQSRLCLTAAEGVRVAVIDGMGFTVSSRWMFAPELQSGAVRRVLSDWTLPPMPLWLVYPSGKLTSIRARAFSNWMDRILDESH